MMDIETREKRKRRFDKTKHAKHEEIVKGDKVLVKQQKTTIKPPYDPKPYRVTKVIGTQITATRAGKETIRNKAKVKVVKDRPVHLQHLAKENIHQEYWDSDDDLDIQLESMDQVQEEQIQGELMQEEQVQMQDLGLERSEEEGPELQQTTGAPQRKSGRKRKEPCRYGEMASEQGNQYQLSPRERRRVRSLAARKVPKEDWRIKEKGGKELSIVFQRKHMQESESD